MTFINRLLLGLLVMAGLNACSSLLPIIQPPDKPKNVQTEPLTSIQAKVKQLKDQPNAYQVDASKNQPSPVAQEQFEKVLGLILQDKLSDAKDALLAMSEQHPNLSGIWLQLALVTKKQGKTDMQQSRENIRSYLNKAIAVNPLNYHAHNELALLLRQQGQFELALKHYVLAINSWPAFANAYLNRGILYDLYMGKKALALEDYQLYQALADNQSRQLKGWIIDLQRQLANAEQAVQIGAKL